MKKFILGLFLLTSTAFAQQGVIASYVRLQPSSLPGKCNLGDLRTDTITSLIYYCNGSNTWVSFTGSATSAVNLIGGAAGSVPFQSATNTTSFLAAGSSGQVLTIASGLPSWSTPTGLSPLTTKGDLYGFSTLGARLPVGTDGFLLAADSTQTLGLKWVAGLSNPMSASGDIIYGGAAGAATRLAKGTDGTVLTLASGLPSWAPAGTASPLTTKGDLYGFSTVNARLPIGTDTYVLTADSSQSLGVKWAAASGGSSSVNAYSVLGNNTSSTATGTSIQSLLIGTPGFTDTGVASQFTGSNATYFQHILQNTSSGTGASADYIVSNNSGTASTFYGDFGMNSSTFTGTGSFQLPNATFLYSQTGDLVLGTHTSNATHFVINNGATDAMTINTSGNLVLPALSTAGVLLNSASGVVSSSAGALSVPNGGTGTTSFPLGSFPLGNGILGMSALPAPATDNQAIISDSSANTKSIFQYPTSKNYVSNPGFESNTTTNWSLGTATLTNGLPSGAPTFGSGASGNLSIAAVSSGKLAGAYSLSYISSAATTAGNFVASNAFTIDAEDQAKVLTFKFYYAVNSGTVNTSGTSSNSYGVAIYDVTNSAWIIPAGVFNIVQGTGVGYSTGTFQTTSNSTSYRLVVYNATATSGAATMYFDDFSVGPQTAPTGPAMSDFGTQSWTPTGTWSTNTTYTGKWRRVGDSMQLNANIALTGAPTGTFTLNIPTGYTIDTTKISNSSFQVSGSAYGTTGGGATNIQGAVYVSSTSALKIVTGGNWSATVPGTFASSDFITVQAMVPIVGWSSNSVMSSDTDTRVIAMQVAQAVPTATLTGTVSLVKYTSGVVTDTAGAYSTTTGLYTCPVSGQYRVTTALQISATYTLGSTAQVGISKNGAAPIYIAAVSAGGAQGQLFPYISTIIPCNAGDTFAPYAASSGSSPSIGSGATTNYFMVERLSGPAVIQATESVSARYYQITTQASLTTTDTQVNFDTKDYDTHNAVTTGAGSWKFTAPVSGKYRLSYNVATSNTSWTLGQYIYAQLYKNGSAINGGNTGKTIALAQATQTFRLNVGGSDSISLAAGDYIDVRANSNGTTVTPWNANGVWIAIERVGN